MDHGMSRRYLYRELYIYTETLTTFVLSNLIFSLFLLGRAFSFSYRIKGARSSYWIFSRLSKFSRKALAAGEKTAKKDLMEKKEPFVHSEVDDEQSPQNIQTWPMDKIRKSRFQKKMPSLLIPVTPKRTYSISNAKSLLLQCLRDSKSDPIPRKRFPVSCSDEGILMDGVLVTSATGKKVSDSPSSLISLKRSARSSLVRIQHKNTEFSSPRSLSGRNQTSSGGKVKMLAHSPCTEVETPKAANPSTLKATAEPFILTPRSSQSLASPVPVHQLPSDHRPHFQLGLTPSYDHLYLPPSNTYARSLQGPDLYQTHYPSRSPRPTGYEFNQLPDPRISLTPLSSHLNTNTRKPPLHTPMSTTPTANLSTSTTNHGSRLTSSPSVDGGLERVTQKPYLSSSSDELETMTQKQGLSSPSDELVTMTQTQEVWSLSDELKTSTDKPYFSTSDGLPRFTQAQTDFMKSQDRVLPDDAFEHYKYRKRLPIFTQLCLDDKEGCDNTTYQAHTPFQTRPLLPL